MAVKQMNDFAVRKENLYRDDGNTGGCVNDVDDAAYNGA